VPNSALQPSQSAVTPPAGATDSRHLPINGPLLLEWARTALAPGVDLPEEAGSVGGACAALRVQLRGR
jgi:hypothetical protein